MHAETDTQLKADIPQMHPASAAEWIVACSMPKKGSKDYDDEEHLLG